jgi:hypothetical protein
VIVIQTEVSTVTSEQEEPKSDKSKSAEEAAAVEAMRKIAEGDAPPLTPEEAEAAAKAEREYVENLGKRRQIDTPIYKPPM